MKLMGKFCPVCQIEDGFLIYEWKNVMDAHGSFSLETVLLGTQDNC